MENIDILVISDTHSNHHRLEQIVQKESFQMVYHLGDAEGQERQIQSICNAPLEIVRGNCDIFSSLPEDRLIYTENHKIFLTHGHLYGAKAGHSGLRKAAAQMVADIVFYGHTHVPVVKEYGDMVIANPGSITYPRGIGPSYIMMHISGNNKPEINIKYL